jgi:hypothetical protein
MFARTQRYKNLEDKDMTVSKPGDNGNNSNESQKGSTMNEAFDSTKAAGSVGNGEQAQAGRSQRTAGAAPNAQARRSPRQFTVMDINSQFGRPISRRSSGEAVQAFEKAFRKEIDASMGDNYKDSFSLHVLNNATNQTLLSSILVVLAVQAADGTTHGLVFNLIVEGSGSRRDNKTININGQNVEIEWVPGDVASDKILWDKITLLLNDAFGREMVLHYTGAMVLPTTLSSEDSDHIHRIMHATTQALFTAMETEVTEDEVAISVRMIDNNAQISANLDYMPAPMTNVVGQPVRNDLQITLKGQMVGTAQQGYGDVPIDLTRAAGFIDLTYAEKPTPVFGQPPVTQSYYPRVVLTHLDSEVDAMTPELQILGLSTTTLLARQMQWGAAFAPRYGLNTVRDLRDIGAIGYEVNLSPDPNAKPERLDTKSQAFGLPQLAQVLGVAVFDSLIFSLDIEETGEMSWLQQVFLAASRGNTDAYAAIVDATNNLTDHQFGRIWQGGAIVIDDENRIPLGWYKGEDGNLHDLRDIDYLAMLNLYGDKDMSVVTAWSDTFLNKAIPEPVRLEQRLRILKGVLLGSDFKVTGFAQRVNFAPEFLIAVATACASAGLAIRQTNVFAAFTGQGGRGAFAGSQLGLQGQQVNAMFSYGAQGAGYGAFRGFNAPAYGRFSGGNV